MNSNKKKKEKEQFIKEAENCVKSRPASVFCENSNF